MNEEIKTMKYILTCIPKFIIEQTYYDEPSYEESSTCIVKHFGLNSGNCMFWEATKKLLEDQSNLKLLNWKDYNENKDEYKDKIEAAVLVLANNICPTAYNQLGVYLNCIRDINCKKYLFSIGAQSSDLSYRTFEHEERELYIEFFGQFEYVYLRGQYTYDLLNYNNVPVTNCEVVGCPSILLKSIDTGDLLSKFEQLKESDINDIKIGINYPTYYQTEMLKYFIEIMSDNDVYTLSVDNPEIYKFVNRMGPFPFTCADKEVIEHNRSNFIFSDNIFKSIEFFRRNTNLMIGTRIHGTILGLMAGIPSICLVIDSRTYELCEAMSIPYINCIETPIEFHTKRELLTIFLQKFDINKLNDIEEIINITKNKYRVQSL